MSSSVSPSAQRPATSARGSHDNQASGAAYPAADAPVVSDAYWVPNVERMDATRRQKPWRADPHYFNAVSVSLSATVKMFMHGTRGCPDMSQGRFNWFEVMGLLIGHFRDRELVLTDSFSLPVAASEVECSMTEASQIYMANYLEYHRRLGKAEPGCVGWYHTHPGYSCFLSGIDVTTQQGSQRMQDPWVALVIDPVETLQTGRFVMKAFRTYPEGYTPDGAAEAKDAAKGSAAPSSPTPVGGDAGAGNYGLPPSNRVKDFGMHAHRYYELPVTVVQSSRDAPLWALLQQHFWPLSLSLSFPFAPSTRTCQCSSAQLSSITAALAVLMNHSSRVNTRDGRAAGLLSGRRGDGRYVPQGMPLLYRAGERASLCVREDEANSAEEAVEEKKTAMERRLLTLASDALQARSEAFSLATASRPVHPELLQALRVLSEATNAAAVTEAKR